MFYILIVMMVQFSSAAQSCPTLCHPMNHSTPGLPVHHQLPKFIQTHVHRVGDAIQPAHPLSSPSPLAPNPSQHQSLFQWVNSSHEVAKGGYAHIQLSIESVFIDQLSVPESKHSVPVQLLSRDWLFATPWTAASLSITNSQSLLKLMSIMSVMPSNHLIICCTLSLSIAL